MNHVLQFFLFSIWAFCDADRPPTDKAGVTYIDIKTEFGWYRGANAISQQGTPYYKFRGIPYAIADERFKESRPYDEPWTDRKYVVKYMANCLQFDPLHFEIKPDANRSYRVTGREDCLYLNVHTYLSMNDRRPVIFLIHGGGYEFGGPDQYSSQYIMDRNVVFVNFAYRLGPMGFLSTGDTVIPGNMGLKDQLVALQWVNQYIELFGGDKNRITITGVGAGGASVHYMYLSPLTTGLFKNGFAHSGSALSPWAIWYDIPRKTRQLAANLGCSDFRSETMVQCLRKVDAELLVAATYFFKVFLYNPFTIFGPVVDETSPYPYIPEAPMKLLQKGQFQKLPFISGFTLDDALFPAAEYILNTTGLQRLIDNWDEILPNILFYDKNCPPEISKNVLNWLENFREDNSYSFAYALLRLMTNRLIILPTFQSAMLMSKNNTAPMRVFNFQYEGAYSSAHLVKNPTDANRGLVAQGDDASYIFSNKRLNMHQFLRDYDMSQEMINLLVTFAENSTVPDDFSMWKPATPDLRTFAFLNILGGKNYVFSEGQIHLMPNVNEAIKYCPN